MSDRHLQCSTCGIIRPASEARSIPTFRAESESYIDGYYCDEHATAALDAARAHIRALDLEDDQGDPMTPLLTLHALLRARGQMTESLTTEESQGEGMERIRRQALALLNRLTDVRLSIVEPSVLCSACLRALPASQIRVIPWHNDGLGDFVTTFRCGECVADSLADTRARLSAGDAHTVGLLGEFFRRHAITILEHGRGDPPEVVRPLLAQVLDMIESGALALQIGETVPLEDVLEDAPAPASPPASSPPAETAPSPSLWQRIRGLIGGG